MQHKNDNLGLRLINGDFSDKQNSICCPNATDRPLMDSFITALDVKCWGNTCCISKAQMTMHPMYNTVWSQVTMEFHQRTRLPLETSMHWECVSAESVSMVSLDTGIYKQWNV